jgi:hypothetical protein
LPLRRANLRACPAPLLAALLAAPLLVLALVLGGCGSSGAKTTTTVRHEPLETIFEADAELQANPAGTLEEFKRLGVDRVRVYVPWGALGSRPPLAPDPLSRIPPKHFDATDPASYPRSGWAIFDQIDREARARGIGLDYTLGPPAPVWATQRGQPPGPVGVWKPSETAFGKFVQAVATRYSGHYADPQHPGRKLPRVSFWGVWNEPNLGIDLAPQAVDRGKLEVSPMFYRRIVDAAWRAFQATGHGHDTILIGELAPQGRSVGPYPGNFDMMVPLRFLRTLYCVDASYRQLRGTAAAQRGCPATAAGSAAFASQHPGLFHATAVAAHPYPQNQAPNVPNRLEPDYGDFAALLNIERALDRLQAVYGSSTRFSIYSTEFGYKTNPPEKLIRAIPPPLAAAYLNQAEYMSWRDPRIRSYDQYLLKDSPAGNFATGLEFSNGTPKPTYDAFRLPVWLPATTINKGQQVEVWGCARGARYTGLQNGGTTQVEIEFRAASGGDFKRLRTVTVTDPYGYFDVRQAFPASGTVRLRWTDPHGPAIFSRSVTVSVH